MNGTVDGNRIRLSSSERLNAQSVPFTFTGTVANDAIEGDLAMGEYLAAKFTAKRFAQAQMGGGRS
jgi:hypothetical protein